MVFGFVFSTPRMARKREFRESTQISTNVKIYRKMWQWCFLKKSLVLQIRQNLKKSIASWGRKSGVFFYLFIYFFFISKYLIKGSLTQKFRWNQKHWGVIPVWFVVELPINQVIWVTAYLSYRGEIIADICQIGVGVRKKRKKKKHNLEVIHSNEKRPWDYDMTLLELSALCSLRYR